MAAAAAPVRSDLPSRAASAPASCSMPPVRLANGLPRRCASSGGGAGGGDGRGFGGGAAGRRPALRSAGKVAARLSRQGSARWMPAKSGSPSTRSSSAP